MQNLRMRPMRPEYRVQGNEEDDALRLSDHDMQEPDALAAQDTLGGLIWNDDTKSWFGWLEDMSQSKMPLEHVRFFCIMHTAMLWQDNMLSDEQKGKLLQSIQSELLSSNLYKNKQQNIYAVVVPAACLLARRICRHKSKLATKEDPFEQSKYIYCLESNNWSDAQRSYLKSIKAFEDRLGLPHETQYTGNLFARMKRDSPQALHEVHAYLDPNGLLNLDEPT